MNKTEIKNFAVWARNKLIADITYKAGLIGVSEKGIAQPLPQSSKDLQFFDIGTKDYAQVAGADIEQRNALVRAVQEKERTSDYKTALKAVIEEVAYTWFNRLIAIRFMEVNEYLPSRIRVLSSENPAKNEPDFVTTPFDTDMEFSMAEQDKIMQLKDENKLDELFRMLFIKQCNKLHEILPKLFEETNNYTELLLNISFTDNDDIVYHLVHDIPEDDFNVEKEGQVEIIGWMYQYYNIEPKDETFALLKKNVKITKERIPAATQLFTPDWIVRYMVENSLGRLWVEGHPSDSLKENWKYYLEEAEQEASIQAQLEQIRAEYRKLNPEDMKVIDPCMGSGHILVYCFDVLMQIYESQGYTQRDAAQSILENNLFGLDIDKRAAQLAYFAVMMKARQYDRRIFNREINPHVYAIVESNHVDKFAVEYFCNGDAKLKAAMDTMISELHDAKEYGSILTVTRQDWSALYARFAEISKDIHMSRDTALAELLPLVQVAEALAQKYEVVVTNPPYMAVSNAGAKVNDYVKKNFPDSKADFFAVFIEHCLSMLKPSGFEAMITQQSFMFAPSFTRFRDNVVYDRLINLIHIGFNSFPELNSKVALGAAFVMSANRISGYETRYLDLNSEYPPSSEKEDAFWKEKDKGYVARSNLFDNIPNHALTYSFSRAMLNAFSADKIEAYITSDGQTKTGNNDKYMRGIWEIDRNLIGVGKKWSLIAKGGDSRKWYGNILDLIDWSDAARHHYKKDKVARIAPEYIWFRKGICWNHIATSKGFAARYLSADCLFETASPAILIDDEEIIAVIMAFLNTPITRKMMELLNPSVCKNVGDVTGLPLLSLDEKSKQEVISLSTENQKIAKTDWDSFELSWDFLVHPLVLAAEVPDLNGGHKATLADAYAKWEALCEKRFSQLKANEEELNRIFIDIYGLQDELTPEVEDKDVTVRKADLGRDIRSLLSYAVGCMFGRYSLDEPGLAYAGGEWDISKYSTFVPDKDNCIPITDEAYFEDDLVGQFVGWMKKAFGEEDLEANLDFIAKALGNKGTTSREVIRNYFLNNFMKDHIKIYQKRPIYWLFDSGKQDGFKALVYMHRWNADTVGNLRVEYLHKMQHTYEREIVRMQETIDNSRDSREVSKATKRKDKLQKQLKETKDYDAKLAHIALSRIDIDLDDGVKVNYEKVQTGRDGKKMQILAKI